mmetsp:Transcript_99113/g.170692  ORF Transcript_99113/g.170692 Transcript_99113/m.170692 type:complete len:93 (-) Transcript_99113:111-389(-)
MNIGYSIHLPSLLSLTLHQKIPDDQKAFNHGCHVVSVDNLVMVFYNTMMQILTTDSNVMVALQGSTTMGQQQQQGSTTMVAIFQGHRAFTLV